MMIVFLRSWRINILTLSLENYRSLIRLGKGLLSKIVLLSYRYECDIMSEVVFTKMSSKGQIVVPKAIRQMLDLHEGEIFALFGENDTLILKRIEMPSKDEFEQILRWGHEYAKKKGIKRKDIMKAIEDVRS